VQPLPAEAVAEVWKVSSEIARQLRFPQDIEWTWRGGQLYVLQSRPITTIADVYYSRGIEPWQNDPAADPDNPSRTWSRMLADETWVSPISPLFYNVHNSTPGRVGFIRSHGDRSPLPPDMFKYHRATAYVDVSVIRRMYEFQPRMARIRGIVNFLPAGTQESFRQAPWRWRGRLRRVLSYEFENRSMRSFFRNFRHVQAQWPDYVAKSNQWLDMNLDALSLDELRAHQAAVQSEMVEVGTPCAIAVLSHASDVHLLLTGLLARWCVHLGSDGENLYARISSGLEDSETLRENEAMWEIANSIRELGPATAQAAQSSSWAQFRQVLLDHAQGAPIIAAFEQFWRDHRHLGSSYKDLIWPRWGDDIDLCFSMLKGHIGSKAERPSEIHARSARLRRDAQHEILASLRGPLAPLRRRILHWLFRYNGVYMAIRDNHRFYVDRNWYQVRRIYRSYGARLETAGVLNTRDEVFFLGMAEVQAALAGNLSGEEAARRVQVRRHVWEGTLRQQGPKFLRGWVPFEDSSRPSGAPAEAQLQGIAASPGSATGAAHIVYDVSGLSAVKDGEILVTRQTDPSWTTVFGRIGGLVLETGGVLSHGTSLCREYGLPCVTAVERATVRIPNGSRIELLGSAGTVRILDRH
jgi:pyruvate,water dikinase